LVLVARRVTKVIKAIRATVVSGATVEIVEIAARRVMPVSVVRRAILVNVVKKDWVLMTWKKNTRTMAAS
jgi:hypothetical protein